MYSNIIRGIKYKKIRWKGYIAGLEYKIHLYKHSVMKSEGMA
jgi:hypothetical protein